MCEAPSTNQWKLRPHLLCVCTCADAWASAGAGATKVTTMKFDRIALPLGWLVASGAIVCGAAVRVLLRRWGIECVDALLPVALVLTAKFVTSRKPEAKLGWIRLTVLELAMTPQWSGHERAMPLGAQLGLIALTFLTTPRVPESRLSLLAIYAAPLAGLVLLRMMF